MMEGRAFLEGKVHHRWYMPNQDTPRMVVLVEHRGERSLAASFCTSLQTGKLSREMKSLSSSENQLKSLDSYFRKLQNDSNGVEHSSSLSRRRTESILDGNDQFKAKKGLTSLEYYFQKLNRGNFSNSTIDANSKTYLSSSPGDETFLAAPSSNVRKGYQSREALKVKNWKNEDIYDAEKNSEDEASNLYLIGILAAIDIAVLLFDMASPVRSSELHVFSLPMLYGAKINQLILSGEWWRLVTPMFLHAGVFHIGLSCWMLATFGPQVCRAYGAFTFFLIFILGGLSGNLISFLHTPDPTVGGTGPVFALIGAFLAYQIQNRGRLIGNNSPENMLQKAVIVACLSCTLNNFGPVDDWTHLGAAFTGFAYGFFTSPVTQVDDKIKIASKSGQQEGIRSHAYSFKSLAYFCFFILLWCSLLLAIEPPL